MIFNNNVIYFNTYSYRNTENNYKYEAIGKRVFVLMKDKFNCPICIVQTVDIFIYREETCPEDGGLFLLCSLSDLTDFRECTLL